MSDQPEMDPQATFRLDQETAHRQEMDRDQWAWDHHVRSHDAIVAQQNAQARWIGAKASLLSTVDTVVWLAVVAAVIYALVLAGQKVFG